MVRNLDKNGLNLGKWAHCSLAF